MSDYIKREDAIEIIARRDDTDGTIKVFNGRFVNGLISAIPSADVVEVVRCKDCKYAEVADPEDSQDGYICQFHRGCIWFSGSYCSWAERKES